jgi:hypothetical protein
MLQLNPTAAPPAARHLSTRLPALAACHACAQRIDADALPEAEDVVGWGMTNRLSLTANWPMTRS